MRDSGYLSHCFATNVFGILGSRAYSCRCANGVRVSNDMQDTAPHHTAVYHAPCSAAARRHLYETKMSEHAAPYGGKSSATANTPPHRAIENGDTPHTAINGTPYIRLYSGKIYVPCRHTALGAVRPRAVAAYFLGIMHGLPSRLRCGTKRTPEPRRKT